MQHPEPKKTLLMLFHYETLSKYSLKEVSGQHFEAGIEGISKNRR